ncbi:hypothetical protein [Streptomyces sviceus]|uniref:hypothetical protein n=1 Tax=Streptomyces sviceus TaxID=285530 RepID=UPI00331A6244
MGRRLGGSATVVRSLARLQQPTAYRAELSDDGRVVARSVETVGKRRRQISGDRPEPVPPRAGDAAGPADGLALDIHGRTRLVYRPLERPSMEVGDARRHKRVKTVRSVRPA